MELTKKQRAVKLWMFANAELFVDECNEINMTRLAEAAADQFGSHEWLDDETSFVWDLALREKERWDNAAPANTVVQS